MEHLAKDSSGHLQRFLKALPESRSKKSKVGGPGQEIGFENADTDPQKRSGWGDFYGAFNDVSIHWREGRTKEGGGHGEFELLLFSWRIGSTEIK